MPLKTLTLAFMLICVFTNICHAQFFKKVSDFDLGFVFYNKTEHRIYAYDDASTIFMRVHPDYATVEDTLLNLPYRPVWMALSQSDAYVYLLSEQKTTIERYNIKKDSIDLTITPTHPFTPSEGLTNLSVGTFSTSHGESVVVASVDQFQNSFVQIYDETSARTEVLTIASSEKASFKSIISCLDSSFIYLHKIDYSLGNNQEKYSLVEARIVQNGIDSILQELPVAEQETFDFQKNTGKFFAKGGEVLERDANTGVISLVGQMPAYAGNSGYMLHPDSSYLYFLMPPAWHVIQYDTKALEVMDTLPMSNLLGCCYGPDRNIAGLTFNVGGNYFGVYSECNNGVNPSIQLDKDTLCYTPAELDTATIFAQNGYRRYFWKSPNNPPFLQYIVTMEPFIKLTQSSAYQYIAEDSLGCMTAWSDVVGVKQVSPPYKPEIFANKTIICQNDTAFLYSNYTNNSIWSSGAVGGQLAVTEAGLYSAHCFNINFATCLSAVSDTITIQKFETPKPELPVITAHIEAPFCYNDTVKIYTAEPLDAYRWLAPVQTDMDTIIYHLQTVGHIYPAVIHLNDIGCMSDTAFADFGILFVQVFPLNPTNNQLQTLYLPGRQYYWYLDGSLVSISDTSIYTPLATGEYSYRLKEGKCLSGFSNHVLIEFVKSSPSPEATFYLSSTLVRNESIIVSTDYFVDFHYTLSSLAGKLMSTGDSMNGTATVQFDNAPTGLYVLQVTDKYSNARKSFKVIKM